MAREARFDQLLKLNAHQGFRVSDNKRLWILPVNSESPVSWVSNNHGRWHLPFGSDNCRIADLGMFHERSLKLRRGHLQALDLDQVLYLPHISTCCRLTRG